MALVESLLLAGKENQKTLSNIEKSLVGSEKREKKESITSRMRERREDQKELRNKRAAKGNGEIVSLLQEIKECVCDCDGKKKGGKGDDNNLLKMLGLGAAGLALAPLLGGIAAIVKLSETLGDLRAKLGEAIKEGLSNAGDWIGDRLGDLQGLPDKVREGLDKALEESGIKNIGDQLQTGTENLVVISERLLDKGKEVTAPVVESVSTAAQEGWDSLIDFGESLKGIDLGAKVNQLFAPMEGSNGFAMDDISSWMEQSPALSLLNQFVQKLGKVAAAVVGIGAAAFNLDGQQFAFQNGGPVWSVPGTGTGDKPNPKTGKPYQLKPGSFVLNRNASNYLRKQKGGSIPAILEPGELVFPKTTNSLKKLNSSIPRFQSGGEVSHPDTGTGFQPGNATDQSGRPVVLSEGAAEAFKKMMDVGGVKGTDVASSRRSAKKNAAVGGVPGSAHLGGNAIDIHGSSKAWMIENSDKFGWKRNNYMADSWHWDFTGKNSGNTGTNKGVNEGNDDKRENKDTEKKAFSIEGILSGASNALTGLFGGGLGTIMGQILGNSDIMGKLSSDQLAQREEDKGWLSNFSGMFGDLFSVLTSKKETENNTDYGAGVGPAGAGGAGATSISDPNAKALLNAIADAEGTSKYANQGYNTQFTGKQFKGTDHPREVINSGGYGSDAAGRYQFLSTTWDGTGGGEMTPERQDKAALKLVSGRGVNLSDGLSKKEVYKLGGEWASIEGGPTMSKGGSYGGQAKFSAEKFLGMYKSYGGQIEELQNGGTVGAYLEGGETVWPSANSALQSLNSAVPRFQTGGMVSPPPTTASNELMRQIEMLTAEITTQNKDPIVVPVPSGGESGGARSESTGNAPPPMPSGPSVNFLTDVINRVNMGSVFS